MSTELKGACWALIIVGVLVTIGSGVMAGVMYFGGVPERRAKLERFEKALKRGGDVALVEGIATADTAPLLASTYTQTAVLAFESKALVSRGKSAEQINVVRQSVPFRLVTPTGAYPVTGPLRAVIDTGEVKAVPGQPNLYELLIRPGDCICVLGALSVGDGVEGFHGPVDIHQESADKILGRERSGLRDIWSLVYGGVGGVVAGIAIILLGRWLLLRIRRAKRALA